MKDPVHETPAVCRGSVPLAGREGLLLQSGQQPFHSHGGPCTNEPHPTEKQKTIKNKPKRELSGIDYVIPNMEK